MVVSAIRSDSTVTTPTVSTESSVSVSLFHQVVVTKRALLEEARDKRFQGIGLGRELIYGAGNGATAVFAGVIGAGQLTSLGEGAILSSGHEKTRPFRAEMNRASRV